MRKHNQTNQSKEPNQNTTPPSEPRPTAPPPEPQLGKATGPATECNDNECQVELSEEYLTAQTHPVLDGEIRIHKEVERVLQHLAVDAEHDEVYVEHQPINQEVDGRRAPWQEDDAIVVPVYEEQVVVSRRLVLKEKLRIRRVRATERKHLTEEVSRERPVVEKFGRPAFVHETYADQPRPDATPDRGESPKAKRTSGGLFHRLAEFWDRVA